MRTMQGIVLRRHLVGGLIARAAVYSLLFAAATLVARELIWPALSELLANLTSTWVEVPPESVDFFRLAPWYQEGGLSNGNVTFRDLSDYYAIAAVIKGPVVWGTWAAGLLALTAWWCVHASRTTDRIVATLEHVADGTEPQRLDGVLAPTQTVLDRLAGRECERERKAASAEARKNELVAYLAHDIKTPLTSVVGYLALLAEEPDLPQQRRERYAERALEKARQLDTMMDEFFEITRYNLDAIPIDREQTDLALLLEQLADELLPYALGRSVAIDLDVEDDTRAFIDPEKMARALGNIMRNGIAFANPGSTLTCRVARADGLTTVSVEDTGKEIAPAHLQRIFERFYREDGARSSGGAGLGLAIAKEIVAAHGGNIDARSERGITTFTVSIPDEPAATDPAA